MCRWSLSSLVVCSPPAARTTSRLRRRAGRRTRSPSPRRRQHSNASRPGARDVRHGLRDVPRRRRHGQRPGRREPQPQAAQLHRCGVAGVGHRRGDQEDDPARRPGRRQEPDDARPAAARGAARGPRRAGQDHPRLRQEVDIRAAPVDRARDGAVDRARADGPTPVVAVRDGTSERVRRAAARSVSSSCRATTATSRSSARRTCSRRSCARAGARDALRAAVSRGGRAPRSRGAGAARGDRPARGSVLVARDGKQRRRSCARRARASASRRSIRAARSSSRSASSATRCCSRCSRSSRCGTRCRAGRCSGRSSQLPPPPRTVGAAQGHLWATRPNSDEVFVYRLSDGRPFRHYAGAPIREVICHPASPLIVLVTPRGLVRLHCFAHSAAARRRCAVDAEHAARPARARRGRRADRCPPTAASRGASRSAAQPPPAIVRRRRQPRRRAAAGLDRRREAARDAGGRGDRAASGRRRRAVARRDATRRARRGRGASRWRRTAASSRAASTPSCRSSRSTPSSASSRSGSDFGGRRAARWPRCTRCTSSASRRSRSRGSRRALGDWTEALGQGDLARARAARPHAAARSRCAARSPSCSTAPRRATSASSAARLTTPRAGRVPGRRATAAPTPRSRPSSRRSSAGSRSSRATSRPACSRRACTARPPCRSHRRPTSRARGRAVPGSCSCCTARRRRTCGRPTSPRRSPRSASRHELAVTSAGASSTDFSNSAFASFAASTTRVRAHAHAVVLLAVDVGLRHDAVKPCALTIEERLRLVLVLERRQLQRELRFFSASRASRRRSSCRRLRLVGLLARASVLGLRFASGLLLGLRSRFASGFGSCASARLLDFARPSASSLFASRLHSAGFGSGRLRAPSRSRRSASRHRVGCGLAAAQRALERQPAAALEPIERRERIDRRRVVRTLDVAARLDPPADHHAEHEHHARRSRLRRRTGRRSDDRRG